jgi:hypothetical protein
MRTIGALAVLFLLAVVIVPDWVYPEDLGPRPFVEKPDCLACL